MRCALFEDLGNLYIEMGDLKKEKYNQLTKSPDNDEKIHVYLNDVLKCYTDAAIFYQYSLLAQLQGQIVGKDAETYQQLDLIQQKILLSINGDSSIDLSNLNIKSVEHSSKINKESLLEIREDTKIELDRIKTYNNKEEYNNDIPNLFNKISGEIQNFLGKLYEETIEELQQKLWIEAPCKYAIDGLGSMALNQITPYSDLEFAIIIEKYTPETIQYFSKLSHLVHFKCINLGETIIATSKYGVDMSGLDKQGVNFDLGGKTPLGRIGEDKVYDLIGTVEHLMCYVKSDEPTDKLYLLFWKIFALWKVVKV